jgi:hypothetical protein
MNVLSIKFICIPLSKIPSHEKQNVLYIPKYSTVKLVFNSHCGKMTEQNVLYIPKYSTVKLVFNSHCGKMTA